MLPDQAAERLQLSERGLDLLDLCEREPKTLKAIELVQAGFHPRDVATKYGLEWIEPEEPEPEEMEEGAIQVWECKVPRCRQKGRVSTASAQPDCPSCRTAMEFVMSVSDESEISHMRRTFVPDPGLRDPFYRTDKLNAPDYAMGDE